MFNELIYQAAIGYFGSRIASDDDGGWGPNPGPDDGPRPPGWPWWKRFFSRFLVASIGGIVFGKFIGAGLGVESLFATSLISMAGGKLFADLGKGAGFVG